MENNEKKSSMMKFWPLWLIIIIIAITLISKTANRKAVDKVVEQAQTDMNLSGKALSQVPNEQLFMANWFGKKCPDFTVTTLDGKEIQLSSLSGKQVMFVFWATWCPPCRKEIPHIIDLREQIDADELEIIAFSSEKADVVRNFVDGKGINYTIATGEVQQLPEPFNRVRALPSMFFINSDQTLKLALEGGISLEQMKGIIEAQ